MQSYLDLFKFFCLRYYSKNITFCFVSIKMFIESLSKIKWFHLLLKIKMQKQWFWPTNLKLKTILLSVTTQRRESLRFLKVSRCLGYWIPSFRLLKEDQMFRRPSLHFLKKQLLLSCLELETQKWRQPKSIVTFENLVHTMFECVW